MDKQINELVDKLKSLFNQKEIEQLARETGFTKRKSKMAPEIFMALCIFHGEDLCTDSLVQIHSQLKIEEGLIISPQAVDKRFEQDESVAFIMSIFNKMLTLQNEVLSKEISWLRTHFSSINVTDSTIIQLPKEYADKYTGCGGDSSKSSIKIQLELELLSGAFKKCEVFEGRSSDINFLRTLKEDMQPNSLNLKDLGYFKIEDLKDIEERNAYYISKLKSNMTLYRLNPTPEYNKNGEVKESTKYTKIDIIEILKPLAVGETLELNDIYISKIKKPCNRFIVTKLNKHCKDIKFKKHKKNVRKQRIVDSSFTRSRLEYNCYISNVPREILGTNQIHEMYSLRWQIELMFKVWKSVFGIDKVKKVKVNRFECFLYGRLIALLLTGSIVSTMRDNTADMTSELSEKKAFSLIKKHFHKLRISLFKRKKHLVTLLADFKSSIMVYGVKSHKKGKKTPYDILQNTISYESESPPFAS
ncbi:MAG TPA: IS4 family transposase [Epulopiscium sp.]|nr:IS4 family transposase [Candidatus Epulonipiscium sp.]